MNAMLRVGINHHYWKQKYNLVTYSEENCEIDTYGQCGKKGEKVIVIIHGGGLITEKKLKVAQNENNLQKPIKYTQEEFDTLLSGQDMSGKKITLYNYKEIRT